MFIAEREGFEPPVPLSTTVFKTVVIDHSTISPFVEGFEPPVPLSTTVFKTVVIDHSTISPFVGKASFVFKSECKGKQFFSFLQIFCHFFALKFVSLPVCVGVDCRGCCVCTVYGLYAIL